MATKLLYSLLFHGLHSCPRVTIRWCVKHVDNRSHLRRLIWHPSPSNKVQVSTDCRHRDKIGRRQSLTSRSIDLTPNIQIPIILFDLSLPCIETVAGAEQLLVDGDDLIRRNVQLPHSDDQIPPGTITIVHLNRTPLHIADVITVTGKSTNDMEFPLPRNSDTFVAASTHLRQRLPFVHRRVINFCRRHSGSAVELTFPAGDVNLVANDGAGKIESRDDERRAIVPHIFTHVVPQNLSPDFQLASGSPVDSRCHFLAEATADDVYAISDRNHWKAFKSIVFQKSRDCSNSVPWIFLWVVTIDPVWDVGALWSIFAAIRYTDLENGRWVSGRRPRWRGGGNWKRPHMDKREGVWSEGRGIEQWRSMENKYTKQSETSKVCNLFASKLRESGEKREVVQNSGFIQLLIKTKKFSCSSHILAFPFRLLLKKCFDVGSHNPPAQRSCWHTARCHTICNRLSLPLIDIIRFAMLRIDAKAWKQQIKMSQNNPSYHILYQPY